MDTGTQITVVVSKGTEIYDEVQFVHSTNFSNCNRLGIIDGKVNFLSQTYMLSYTRRMDLFKMYLELYGVKEEAMNYQSENNFFDADIVTNEKEKNMLAFIYNHPEYNINGTDLMEIDSYSSVTFVDAPLNIPLDNQTSKCHIICYTIFRWCSYADR